MAQHESLLNDSLQGRAPGLNLGAWGVLRSCLKLRVKRLVTGTTIGDRGEETCCCLWLPQDHGKLRTFWGEGGLANISPPPINYRRCLAQLGAYLSNWVFVRFGGPPLLALQGSQLFETRLLEFGLVLSDLRKS